MEWIDLVYWGFFMLSTIYIFFLLQLRSHSPITLVPFIILSPPAPLQAASRPNTPPPVQDRYVQLPINSNYTPIPQTLSKNLIFYLTKKYSHKKSQQKTKFQLPLVMILNMFCVDCLSFLVWSVWSSASVFVPLWADVSPHTP